jgi:geranyl-CoA carboxylase alpha subunit
MIAKLISVGRTRDEARRKLIAALDDLVALGLTTNQTFLRDCLAHPVFAAGAPTTAFIERFGTDLLEKQLTACDPKTLAIAAVLLVVFHPDRSVNASPALPLRWPVRTVFAIDSVDATAAVLALENGVFCVTAGLSTTSIRVLQVTGSLVRFECSGVVESTVAIWSGEELFFHFAGRPHHVKDHGFQHAAGKDALRDATIRASMNGRVVAVHATVGDVLKAGQPVFTIEAMKMEHVHAAPVGGRLVTLATQVGQQVVAARVVAAIEPESVATEPSQAAKSVDSV